MKWILDSIQRISNMWCEGVKCVLVGLHIWAQMFHSDSFLWLKKLLLLSQLRGLFGCAAEGLRRGTWRFFLLGFAFSFLWQFFCWWRPEDAHGRPPVFNDFGLRDKSHHHIHLFNHLLQRHILQMRKKQNQNFFFSCFHITLKFLSFQLRFKN